MNPDVSGLFVGQILRLRLRMTKDEGLFGQALSLFRRNNSHEFIGVVCLVLMESSPTRTIKPD